MHTVRVNLIADQEIVLLGHVVNIHTLRSITLNDAGYVITFKTAENEVHVAEVGPYIGLTAATAEELESHGLIPVSGPVENSLGRIGEINPAILKRYILVDQPLVDYRIALYGKPEVRFVDDHDLIKSLADSGLGYTSQPTVYAIYQPTGRGPFRGMDGRPHWEFEYQGVEVR